MSIQTESIGSIPRLSSLLEAIATHGCDAEVVGPLYDAVIRDTVARFEGTRLAAEALGV